MKLSRLVKVRENPPMLYFFDCDMERIHSASVSDTESVEEALDGALSQYAHREIGWESYNEDAVKSSTDKRFVVLAFTSERDDCKATMKAFEDRSMVKHQAWIRYMSQEFVQDSAEAKKWGVMASESYLMIDANKDGKVIKRLQGKRTAGEIRKWIVDGLKATEPKKGEPGASSNSIK